MAIDTEAADLQQHRTSACRVLILDQRRRLAAAIAQRLISPGGSRRSERIAAASVAVHGQQPADAAHHVRDHDVVVFSPLWPTRGRLTPNIDYAEAVFAACRDNAIGHLVLISSAEIYGADYTHPGMIGEKRIAVLKRPNTIASAWSTIEALAHNFARLSDCRLSTLRPCFVLSGDRREFATRLFQSRIAFPPAGYDPRMQVLSLQDFASAVATVVEQGQGDIFHVAPQEVVSLRQALRLARVRCLPVPYLMQRALRALLAPVGLADSTEQIAFLRYPWTVSSQRLTQKLGWIPCCSTVQAVSAQRTEKCPPQNGPVRCSASPQSPAVDCDQRSHIDALGMEEPYIRWCSRWHFAFLEKWYWRIETEGLERIPRDGGAVLAGIHRGFMPLDGVMLVHLISQYCGRVPRFLMHPGLVKFPYLAPLLTKLGGIIACQENADRVLARNEILGVFPEGIRGAFRLYNRQIYKIEKQRGDFIRAALKHRVPIIPFVAVGPAEMFPILARINWSWWKRYSHWPFFPITPTANLIPLPTKWHVRILDPISTQEYAQGAEQDGETVAVLSQLVRRRMQTAIDDLVSRRRSVFYGSLCESGSAGGAAEKEAASDARFPSAATELQDLA